MNPSFRNPYFKYPVKTWRPSPKRTVERGSFLSCKYPNKEASLADLIQTLEKSILEPINSVHFDDIAGLESVKSLIYESVILPVHQPSQQVSTARSLLMFGAPGTGKTLLGNSIAAFEAIVVFKISTDQFFYQRNQQEAYFKTLFEMAQFYAPSTIFIDDFDSLFINYYDRDDVDQLKILISELIHVLDQNTEQLVFFLAASSRPWNLDAPVVNIFEQLAYIPLPDPKSRKFLFETLLENKEKELGLFKNLV